MRAAVDGRFASILTIEGKEQRIALIPDRRGVVESEHHTARAKIVACRRQTEREQRKKVRDMGIGVVDLLAEAMVSPLLVQLGAQPRIVQLGMLVEGRFLLNQYGWRNRRKLKIELAAFEDALRRRKEENLVFHNWAANLHAWVPAQQKRCLAI